MMRGREKERMKERENRTRRYLDRIRGRENRGRHTGNG